ncbi:TetR/AcrR family transcriptional regulator [Candidatus Macondimonas diazotrophica]|uniref:TetR/AcrR family transcriptional regulator n=1 Tax=Candidatus Macondimonas diazotrophica TaxID=2305248 RepID=A0A4Z0F8Q2_9GAMM|nr:TetR/AcrR family transcriptional regulator [Candidatus Macondimonas diazotrophica]NCU01818.1 TetR/AcrR family transcriptional regulator [Candidatus Macondimonas diazotrophica]TFZ81892.1 TetR/AcrR family transcriptional regulator [Candidatus Macondimonas diazotrophica]
MDRKKSAQFDKKTEILAVSVPMFAAYGYNKVTIRDIGAAAGMTSAALYYHFQDKQTLYREALKFSFQSKAEITHAILSSQGTPEERLAAFIERYTQLLADDPDFRRVMQRELLDGDEESVGMLSELFQQPFDELAAIVEVLAPATDIHMVIMSIIAMILYHYEVGPLRRLLPGAKPEHEDYRTLATHIKRLIFSMLEKEVPADLPPTTVPTALG